MGSGDVARYGEAKSGAAFILISRRIETIEGSESLFPQFRRYSDPIIIDLNRNKPRFSVR